jgi:hypothetical protein
MLEMNAWLTFFVFQNSGVKVCSHKEIGGRDEEECPCFLCLPEFLWQCLSFLTKRLVAGLKNLCLLYSFGAVKNAEDEMLSCAI